MRTACYQAGLQLFLHDSKKEEDFGWRFMEKSYSVADEYGDHSHSYTQIEFSAYLIHHRTKCGIWLLYSGNGPTLRDADGCVKPDRFVNLQANKRWAVDSVQGAIESFIARKDRQARIYEGRAAKARHAISMVKGPFS
jgi:hypothetical protein